MWRLWIVVLSVSPIGSSPLQLRPQQVLYAVIDPFSIPNRIEPSATAQAQDISLDGQRTFSIPNRIEPSATFRWRFCVRLAASFSIPNRIEPSATRSRRRWSASAPRPFQYPQSDRALCNDMEVTDGKPGDSTFSIPNRIEPSATTLILLPLSYPIHFQYPQSDRALCNMR